MIEKPHETGRSAKRKTSSTYPKCLKRTCSEGIKNCEKDGQAQILLLETEIFESKKNYNNLVILLKILDAKEDTNNDHKFCAISLCRVFTRLMVSGEMTKRLNATEKELVVIRWLKEQYSKYKKNLISHLCESSSQSIILNLCMRLLKIEGQYLLAGQDYTFPTSFLKEIVKSLLYGQHAFQLTEEFGTKFMEEYDDIRFYTQEAIESELSLETSDWIFDNCLQLLASVESIPNSTDELEDFYLQKPRNVKHPLYSISQHKKRAQAAWLALMQIGTSKSQRKSILKIMAKLIAPWFVKPEILMDFLTDSYNTGGSMSLMALSGVFYLIQESNLDYPLFYNKLYSLLDAGLLHSKHRSKFFRLLDIFLGSTHLPSALVASFIKRLSRLTLNAPPAGIVAVIPWIYNLMKKHPFCTFMIHREIRDLEVRKMIEEKGVEDPFIPEEEDPMESKAAQSCLWEIVMLQSHYHPNVATLAKIISEQFTKHSYNMEDFLDHSYASMLEAESCKVLKKAPVIEFEIPKHIFTESNSKTNGQGSLLTKIWGFDK